MGTILILSIQDMADPKAPSNNAQNAPNSRETTSSSRQGKDAAIIAMLNKSIADADGKSDVNAAEKVAQDYVKEKSYSMKRFFEAHPEEAAKYAKELAKILSEYGKDVKQVHVLCEIAFKNLQWELRSKWTPAYLREKTNDGIDFIKKIGGNWGCETLKKTDYNPQSFEQVRATAWYLEHIVRDPRAQNRFINYLVDAPEEAKKFIAFWERKDNSVRYFLSKENGDGHPQNIDHFVEKLRLEQRKHIVDTIDRKGNVNSDQITKVVQVLSDKDGVNQLMNTMGSSAEATESLLFAFAWKNAKGMAELRKLPNGEKMASDITEAIKKGLKKFYNINTEAGWLDRIGPKGTMEVIARQIVFWNILLQPLSASGKSARLVSMMKYLPELKKDQQVDDLIARYNPDAQNSVDYQAKLYLFLKIFHSQYGKQEGAEKIGAILSSIEAKNKSKIDVTQMDSIVRTKDMNNWGKVKQIFLGESKSVGFTTKAAAKLMEWNKDAQELTGLTWTILGDNLKGISQNLIPEEVEAYDLWFNKKTGDILAYEKNPDNTQKRVWIKAATFGQHLANQQPNEINSVSLRNYVNYLTAKEPATVSDVLMSNFVNGWSNISAFEKLQRFGGLIGVDVLTGATLPNPPKEKEVIRKIFQKYLVGAIKTVAERCIKDHLKDAEGIIAQNLGSENRSAFKAEFANFEKKSPQEQQQFIVWVIAKYIPDRNKRFDIIKQIFNGRAEGAKQQGNMEREALKKENGNKVPTPSSDLKKQLLSIRVIALAMTSEQSSKVEEMLTALKQTKKYKEKNAATLSDCRYLEYLLSVARTNQWKNGNSAIAQNASTISSRNTIKEAQATTKNTTEMARAKTDEDATKANMNAYLGTKNISISDIKRIEEAARMDPILNGMLHDLAIVSARQTRIASENKEDVAIFITGSTPDQEKLHDFVRSFTNINEKNVEDVVNKDKKTYSESLENTPKKTTLPGSAVLRGDLTPAKMDTLVVGSSYKWIGLEITRTSSGDVKIGNDLKVTAEELPVIQKAIKSLSRIGALDLLPLLPELLKMKGQENIYADGEFGEYEQKHLFETVARVFLPDDKQKEVDAIMKKPEAGVQLKDLRVLIKPRDTSTNFLRENLRDKDWYKDWKLQNLDEIRDAITQHRAGPEKQKS